MKSSSTLYCVSGFASAAFAKHILETSSKLNVQLLVGMVTRSGVAEPDHRGFIDLSDRFKERFECRYFLDATPCHAKCYAYFDGATSRAGFAGSANFTWGGFRDNRECIVECDPLAIRRYHALLAQNIRSVECRSEKAQEYVTKVTRDQVAINRARLDHGIADRDDSVQQVKVSLLPTRGGMHWHSGLNWGQRPGRDPDQAYIPVQASIHKADPYFFPPRSHWFLVQTDDGEIFWCTMAQDNRKGIHTPENNSILGKYFRKRLGVTSGAPVTLADLKRYGRTDVTFYKIDGDLYLMDFGHES
ncbi:phospholipase D family protein [bacterium]|nr:phospholipase D family protein [bacterium]